MKHEKTCEDCWYSEVDWFVDNDDGDEFEVWYCTKDRQRVLDDFDEALNCPHYKEVKSYSGEAQQERFTECDGCEELHTCMYYGYIDCTMSTDTRKHFICNNTHCKKRGAANG